MLAPADPNAAPAAAQLGDAAPAAPDAEASAVPDAAASEVTEVNKEEEDAAAADEAGAPKKRRRTQKENPKGDPIRRQYITRQDKTIQYSCQRQCHAPSETIQYSISCSFGDNTIQ